MGKAGRALAVGCQPLLVADYAPIISYDIWFFTKFFRLIHSLARKEPDKSVVIRNCRRNAKATAQAWAGDGDASDEVVVLVYVLESVWAWQSA